MVEGWCSCHSLGKLRALLNHAFQHRLTLIRCPLVVSGTCERHHRVRPRSVECSMSLPDAKPTDIRRCRPRSQRSIKSVAEVDAHVPWGWLVMYGHRFVRLTE